MVLAAETLTTPAGPFTLLADGGGVRAAGFTASAEALGRRLDPAGADRIRRGGLGGVAAAVTAWFAGELDALDGVPVAQPGDPDLQAAWRALRALPAGRTVSYRRLAELAGLGGEHPGPQTAGAACAANAVAVIVPCHRVLRSDGRLGGYRWGLARKRWLLGHEAAGAAAADRPWVLPGLG